MDGDPVRMSAAGRPGPLRRSSVAALAALLLVGLLAVPSRAYAVEATVNLRTAETYSVLGGSTVTNTGATTLSGDLGLSPGTSITGSPAVNGITHLTDAAAAQAKADLTTAYNDAAGRTTATTVAEELGGTTRTPGAYKSAAGTFGITGTVTLDAQSNPNAVFIFQMGSTLITAAASNIALIGGAQSSHVFWQVGSSATLGAGSTLSGTILAATSITVGAGTAVHGRALARDGAVTLDTNTFTEVGGGALSITVPVGPVSLGSVTASAIAQSVSGQLGLVKVTDTRGGTAGWTATAGATSFSGPQTIEVSATGSSSYVTTVQATVTGTANVVRGNLDHLSAPGQVQVATGVSGNNTASWNPTISVTIPAGALAGLYSTTITHSVS
jgi:hypothetical protein